MKERIEKAIDAYADATVYGGYNKKVRDFEKVRNAGLNRSRVETVLRTAFPELFSSPPTHWLAPIEATEAMKESCHRIDVIEDVPEAWASLRDAYLKGQS